MKRLLILSILLILTISLNAQVNAVYFYGDQVIQDKSKATSYAIYGKLSNEDLWTFKRYDLDDNLIQTGSYADNSLTVAHGKFVFYMDLERFNLFNKTNFKLKGKTRFISQQGNFVNGFEQGRWLLFYPDGSVMNAQDYVNGKQNGLFATYDRYGKIITKGNYVNGEMDGEWLLEKGKVREIYEMGILKSRENVKKPKNIDAKIKY